MKQQLKCYTGQTIKFIGLAHHDRHMIRVMHEINLMATGTNFFLAVRDRFGSIGLYPRVNQPCMGEFRKYKDKNPNDPNAKPHGDLAHGDKLKPHDLYSPFPSGEPVAFGKAFYYHGGDVEKHNDLIRLVFSNDSPWKDAFGDESFVEFTMQDKLIKGVVIKTTDIDPSVFIQLSWTLKNPSMFNWESWINLGFSKREALLISALEGGYSSYTPVQSFNIKRFLTQNPYHLLPMTFREGADYARSSGRGTVGAEGCWQDRTNTIGFNYYSFMEKTLNPLRKAEEVFLPPHLGSKYIRYTPLTPEERAPHWRKVIDEYKDKDDPVEEVVEMKEEKAA